METKGLLFRVMFCLMIAGVSFTASEEMTYLARIEVSIPEEIDRIAEMQIPVFKTMKTYVLVEVADESFKLLAERGFRCQIVDENPREHQYFLVFLRDKTSPEMIREYGEPLFTEGRMALMKISVDQALELKLEGLESLRIPKAPFLLRKGAYVQ
ncbi:MAG: hypothetical protein ACE5OR_13685, partial [bacterium]